MKPTLNPPAPCDILFDFDQDTATAGSLLLRRLLSPSITQLDIRLAIAFARLGDGRYHMPSTPTQSGLNSAEIAELILELARLSNKQPRYAFRESRSEYETYESDDMQFSVTFPLNLFLDVKIRGCRMPMYSQGFELNFHFFYSRVPASTTASREKAMLSSCPAALKASAPTRSL